MPTPLLVRTKGASACAGREETLRLAKRQPCDRGRSGPSARPVPMQDVIVLARNRPPSKSCAPSQSPNPGEHGPGAPRLLRLSRLLGPRYAFATIGVALRRVARTIPVVR